MAWCQTLISLTKVSLSNGGSVCRVCRSSGIGSHSGGSNLSEGRSSIGMGSISWGGVGNGGGYLSDGSGVCRGGISQRSGDLSDGSSVGRGGNDSLSDSRSILVDNSVESVDGISGVLDGTTGAIGLSQRVRSLDNISVAGFLLVLVVSGQSIGDGVRVRVLRVGVVVGVNGDFSNGRNGNLGNCGCSISQRSGNLSDGGGGVCRVCRGGVCRGGICHWCSYLSDGWGSV
jgi:hypothetical protein